MTSESCFASGVDHCRASLEDHLNPCFAVLGTTDRGLACRTALFNKLRELALMTYASSEVP
jgi:hypothetical protein